MKFSVLFIFFACCLAHQHVSGFSGISQLTTQSSPFAPNTPALALQRRATTLQAQASTTDEEEKGFFSQLQINTPYALAYVGFVAFAFYQATNEAPGASQAILEKFLADPVNPGVNNLFATVFNLLGLAAIPIGCIAMPSAKGQSPVPLVPFLLGGVFAGYGSIGIAMSTRKPVTEVSKSELGWVTKNILENKFFNWAVVAISVSTFYSTGCIDALLADAAGQIQGYKELFQSTALASASSCDLAILTVTAASLIPEDLRRRGEVGDGKALAIAASTCLLPIVGAAVYCALRPELPESTD